MIRMPKLPTTGTYLVNGFHMDENYKVIKDTFYNEFFNTATEAAEGFLTSFFHELSCSAPCNWTYHTENGGYNTRIENERADDETVSANLLADALNAALSSHGICLDEKKPHTVLITEHSDCQWVVVWMPKN